MVCLGAEYTSTSRSWLRTRTATDYVARDGLFITTDVSQTIIWLSFGCYDSSYARTAVTKTIDLDDSGQSVESYPGMLFWQTTWVSRLLKETI